MVDDEVLQRLRAVFRDEMEDHLHSIRSHRAILGREQLEPAERQHAVFEIYRAAHSLKGAARTVGEPRVSEICHRLEEALGDARHGVPVDLAVAEQAVDLALEAFGMGAEPPAKPASEVDKPRGGAAATPEVAGTMRVSVEGVRRLLRAADELVTFLGDAPPPSGLATGIDEVTTTLAELRELAGSPEQRRLVDRALTSIGALRRAGVLQDRRERSQRAAMVRRAQVLSHEVRALRLTKAETLCLALEHAVREVAKDSGKVVRFEVQGAQTTADREILERVTEPLLHLVRNAVDHGIEPPALRAAAGKPREGTVRVMLELEGPEVCITVQDDGGGFDLPRLRELARAQGREVDEGAGTREGIELAFLPGLSVRAEATETSGRGVGLDVVRQRILDLQGRINVQTRAGEGTRIDVRLPVQLNAVSGLAFVGAGARYIVPIATVANILRVDPAAVRIIENGTWIRHGERWIPLVSLDEVLSGRAASRSAAERITCLVLTDGARDLGLAVERLVEVREVVARPLGARGGRGVLCGSAVLSADGGVTPLLDVAALLREARPARWSTEAVESSATRLLVVDDSVTTRQLIRVILETAGYEVSVAEDGEAAWRRLTQGGGFDLVVSDIDMPHLDGLGLLRRIRSHPSTRELPVVLVTALGHDEDRRRALELGADAYVVKSRFDQTSLLEIVEGLLP